ncbi:bifunctional 4-hydroxy-2-oxoglutarate aldolase/2-dehydro-3-deoxy-phosphogluconate aldolase [Psychrosphaera sp. B3R10]|uniref:bifunctional 4-hydroxy-2-oxoglutarate aldolase/2-dehydro-3-deoxy-phosphogluconate aldolase n=1 Tax=unclassified Psychrosphaera TaxID=2641570 RepID=UPI001C08A243|nr:MULTISPECIES: bifunctional 4-hydroxy-2-oxoglutarate aldolase/2-dehydro-3-deoxy-phosphogluconate aldolase [unclassified Psychrosphaera]MBU2881721.1 bifunctional 4-hydroxy-2-oxoglutarate aldolase/2-dehydro-3-deoxy-phosphogluconate aldolase [Psychrosphaera sp. I2R16]MBU2990094.1 bifunctional 4-hydroxy-2-oxoglutarate aldolase/2-dehydro-3-deoxy-phosphogluconate aldolase [Psychrosphaera sp. B3R10]
MTSFSTLMGEQTLLPIIQADSPTQGVNIAKAMASAGLKLVEVVLRTEQSLAALTAIKEQVPELIVGAGTITNETILKEAIDAGADFIVTPAVSAKLLEHLVTCGVPVLPGVSNTGDILMAREFGYTELKLFPASLSGGAPFLAAVGSVFQDITFCPTGGVTPQNKGEYLALNNVIAVGGTWVCRKEWVAEENWQAITDACKNAIQ